MNKINKKLLDQLDSMIDEIIAETEDSYTDEILCDMLQDGNKRQEAFEYLLDLASKELGYESEIFAEITMFKGTREALDNLSIRKI